MQKCCQHSLKQTMYKQQLRTNNYAAAWQQMSNFIVRQKKEPLVFYK